MSDLKGIGRLERGDPPGNAFGHSGRVAEPAVMPRVDMPPTPAGNTQPPTTTPSPVVVTQPQGPTPSQPPNLPPPSVEPDAYNPEVNRDLAIPLRGEGVGMKRSASELAPDLRQVKTPQDVQTRFSSDYQLVAKQLHDAPQTPATEKAQRAFEYFTRYAERFVQLANREPPDRSKPAPEVPPEVHEPQAPEGDLLLLPTTEVPEEGTGRTGKEPPKDPSDAKRSRLERLELQVAQPKGRADAPLVDPRLLDRLLLEQLPKTTAAEREALARRFAESLRDLSFQQLRDTSTGKNGIDAAYELLMAQSMREFDAKVARKQMVPDGQWPPPPPTPKSEELVPERRRQAPLEFTGAQPARKELGESPAALSQLQPADPRKDGVEFKVNTLAAELGKVLVSPRDPRESNPVHLEGDEGRTTRKRLGPNMLWNVLHRFRREGAESALEQAKWDRLTFGALMFLIVVTLIAIVLVML